MKRVSATDCEEHFFHKMRVHEAAMMSANANTTFDPSKGTFFRDVPEHWFFLYDKRGEAGIPPKTV